MHTTRSGRKPISLALLATAALLLAMANMGIGCDHDGQTVFRQTATAEIGEGVKLFLGGNSEQAVTTIMNAAVDGVVASIQQAGRGPTPSR